VASLTHAGLTFNAPLSDQRADDLVRRLRIPADATVVDLGCGWGELLLRILAAGPAARGVGVDSAGPALDRGRMLARERGLADRVTFVQHEATTWHEPADIVVCVAASHAMGGTLAALTRCRRLVRPHGRVLIGEGFWSAPPSPEARKTFGDLPELPALVDLAVSAGLRPVYVGASTQDEWDAFESDWRAGLELAEEPEARALAAERREEYLRGYRGVLGFAWLVLAPEPGALVSERSERTRRQSACAHDGAERSEVTA